MRAGGRRGFVEQFPGGAALRGENLLGMERVLAVARVAAVATSAGVCLAAPPPFQPIAAEAVLAAGCAYAGLSPLFLRTAKRLPGSLRSGLLVVLDMLLILAAVLATGAGRSPLQPLLFLGALSAPLRLGSAGAFAITGLYALAWAVLAAPQQRASAAFIALCGVTVALLTIFARRLNTEEVRDPLTDCFGRRPALLFMEHLLASQAFPFSVVLLDFDGFKGINDRFGHATGDEALGVLARLIGRRVRHGDLLARIGGDEFLIVAPGLHGTGALSLAEHIRSTVQGTPLAVAGPGERPRLSCSAGVAEAGAADTVAAILERADRHLYLAKERRNQVVLAAAGPADGMRLS